MLRSFALAVVLMCMGASALAASAPAGERIIEIWNPPEARAGYPHVAIRHAQAHRRKVAVHRVQPAAHRPRSSAAPLVAQTPERHNAPMPARDAAHDKARAEARSDARSDTRFDTRFEAIPRIVTPEGNILRVGTGNAHAAVGH
ncbi:hypothetical protein GCM10027093_27530 [Paraburkholderia jirisanensis]